MPVLCSAWSKTSFRGEQTSVGGLGFAHSVYYYVSNSTLHVCKTSQPRRTRKEVEKKKRGGRLVSCLPFGSVGFSTESFSFTEQARNKLSRSERVGENEKLASLCTHEQGERLFALRSASRYFIIIFYLVTRQTGIITEFLSRLVSLTARRSRMPY